MPNKTKTIKSTDIGGFSGGEKYIAGGILFKFASIDKHGIFGGNFDMSSKVATNELRGLQYFFWRGMQEGLCFPLMCIIDYLGHRLIASSLLPINDESLCCGCSTAG